MGCSDTDYAYLREVVLAESANLIDPSRNALFDTRLTPVARLAGAANLQDLVNILRGGEAGEPASGGGGSHDDQRDELLSRRSAVRGAAVW